MELGLTPLQRQDGPDASEFDDARFRTGWLAASTDPDLTAALRGRGWIDARVADHPFADDYADLLSYLRLGF